MTNLDRLIGGNKKNYSSGSQSFWLVMIHQFFTRTFYTTLPPVNDCFAKVSYNDKNILLV